MNKDIYLNQSETLFRSEFPILALFLCQMADWLIYLSLFISSFMAATVIPMASEAVVGASLAGGADPWAVLILATLGNTLGGMTSYLLGYLGQTERIQRFFGVTTNKTAVWVEKVRPHSYWAALLCWLPIVGDVIAIALGFLKTPILKTTILMAVGKAIRYAVVILLTLQLL